jgi:hypothetical protein
VDIKLAFAAVSQQDASSPAKRKVQSGNHSGRQGKGARVARIQDGLDLSLLSPWPTTTRRTIASRCEFMTR